MSENRPAPADRAHGLEDDCEQEHLPTIERPETDDPQATQHLGMGDAPDPVTLPAPRRDPKETQKARLRDAVDTLSLRHETPRRREDDVSLAPATTRERSSAPPRPARYKWSWRILIAILLGIAVLTASGVSIRNAQGMNQGAVGVGGQQLRAAKLAEADLSGQDLQWANLSQADLRQANLSGADLLGADLSWADLEQANLAAAVLRGADLSGAKVRKAVLTNADLHWAVLHNADLSQADLREADLQWADLENAILEGADLQGANLHNAHTLGAIMPDGTKWTPRTNLRRFTDPTHPEFWQPDDAQTLAQR
jgi:hypothetical protein